MIPPRNDIVFSRTERIAFLAIRGIGLIFLGIAVIQVIGHQYTSSLETLATGAFMVSYSRLLSAMYRRGWTEGQLQLVMREHPELFGD